MEHLINTILEKHAIAMPNVLRDLKPVKWYRETAAKPSFKAKKMVGKGMLVAAPVAYGAHKLSEPPELVQNITPGLPQGQQRGY
jgi:hypothetical protein